MNKLVSKLLESRLQSHIFHLRVSGKNAYEAHITLEDYYSSIVDLVDELAEVYQGKYKLFPFEETYTITNDASLENILQYFQNLAKTVEEFEETDGFLISHIDDILSLIYKTIYKLKHLK